MLETENSLLIVWEPQFSVGIKTKVDCGYHHEDAGGALRCGGCVPGGGGGAGGGVRSEAVKVECDYRNVTWSLVMTGMFLGGGMLLSVPGMRVGRVEGMWGSVLLQQPDHHHHHWLWQDTTLHFGVCVVYCKSLHNHVLHTQGQCM